MPVALVVGAVLGGCAAKAGFTCSNDDDCRDSARAGICELPGYCTFEDDRCSSGRRFAEHAGDGLGGRCTEVPPEIASGGDTSTSVGSQTSAASGETTSGPAETSGPSTSAGASDTSTSGDVATGSTTSPVADCRNGRRDGTETDVDCGGSCSPCGLCLGCAGDADCEQGPCTDGLCSMRTEVTVDWVTDCPDDDSFTFQLPAGTYRATAVGGAGEFMAASKWDTDDSNMGNTWNWWIPCEPLDLDQLATSSNHPTDEEAFMSLIAHEQTVVLDGRPVSCGLIDSNCKDNRGGVTFALELVCS